MYDKVCANCGTRLSDFYRTGMLGCQECYGAFGREVITALKKVQGKTFHVGKLPKYVGLDRELLVEYQRLLNEKERATIDGRFDKVKELSAAIVELSGELKRRGLI